MQIKGILNIRNNMSLTLSNKAIIKSCNFFVFPLVSCANPGRCADCKSTFSLFQPVSSPALSDRDNDVEVESVVGFSEAQDEEQPEQTRSREAPVEPGKLCKAEDRLDLRVIQHAPCLKLPKLVILQARNTAGGFEGSCCLLNKNLPALQSIDG